ncbi:MAG: hypothetical protein K940chlam7_01621 [Chlamydiae bacterium]|nr:hypothetical protein [Chlamydiota bacterium]
MEQQFVAVVAKKTVCYNEMKMRVEIESLSEMVDIRVSFAKKTKKGTAPPCASSNTFNSSLALFPENPSGD